MLLYEALLNNKGSVIGLEDVDLDELWEDLARATVVKVDNVARFYYESSDQEYWSLTKDFPNVAPPWSAMFFEFAVPQYSNNQGKLIYLPTHGWKIGMMVIVHEHDEVLPGDIRWTYQAINFYSDPRCRRIASNFYCQLPITSEGAVVTNQDGKIAYAARIDEDPWTSNQRLMYLHVPFLAISFAHCKNVKVTTVDPPEKLSRKQEKRHGIPKSRYHVLEIDPMRKVLETEGGLSNVGPQKALHICCGHFKTYDEKPLFGRVKGTFWWPSHARGSASEGVVTKDYKVKAPE